MCSFSTSISLALRLARRPSSTPATGIVKRVPGRHDHRALDDVAQLADVAGPGIRLQRGHVVPGDRLDALAERLRELLDEAPDQQRNVLGPLAQRRHADREDVEPVVQVLAERPRRDQLLEIAVGRGDDPHVDVDRLRAPRAARSAAPRARAAA